MEDMRDRHKQRGEDSSVDVEKRVDVKVVAV